jgi:hypothetical protein
MELLRGVMTIQCMVRCERTLPVYIALHKMVGSADNWREYIEWTEGHSYHTTGGKDPSRPRNDGNDARKGHPDRSKAYARTDNSAYCVHCCQIQVYTEARRPSEQLGS